MSKCNKQPSYTNSVLKLTHLLKSLLQQRVFVSFTVEPPSLPHPLNQRAQGAALYLLFKTQAMTEIHFQFIFQSYEKKRGGDYSIESSSGW